MHSGVSAAACASRRCQDSEACLPASGPVLSPIYFITFYDIHLFTSSPLMSSIQLLHYLWHPPQIYRHRLRRPPSIHCITSNFIHTSNSALWLNLSICFITCDILHPSTSSILTFSTYLLHYLWRPAHIYFTTSDDIHPHTSSNLTSSAHILHDLGRHLHNYITTSNVSHPQTSPSLTFSFGTTAGWAASQATYTVSVDFSYGKHAVNITYDTHLPRRFWRPLFTSVWWLS